MQSEGFERSLRTLTRRQPFLPFTVELTSGSRFQVDHPEALMVRNGVAVYFAADGEIMLFDHDTVARFARGGKENGSLKNRDKS